MVIRKILIIIGIVLITFFALGVIKDQVIKTVITIGATNVMGAPVSIDGLSFGILKQSVRVRGLRLYNPKGFPKEVLINIAQISIDYNLIALLNKTVYFPSVIVNLKEVVVVKNKEGELNFEALKFTRELKKLSHGAEGKEDEKKKIRKIVKKPFFIDRLTLSIGRVIYKDYSQKDEPFISVFKIGIQEKTFKNINSAQQLATLIMFEALKSTRIKGSVLYTAATVLGVGFIPVGVAGALISKDSVSADFKIDYEKSYNEILALIKQIGKVVSEDKEGGLIKAKVRGSGIAIKITKELQEKIRVKVSARKFFIPKLHIARGVLYQISERLEKTGSFRESVNIF